MVTLTARAGALLRSLQGAQAGSTLPRLTITAGAFSIDASSPAMDDAIVYQDGTPVLLIASDAATALGGQILTARDRQDGPALVIMPSTMPWMRRGRTLRVGGKARLTPALALARGADFYAGLRARTRRLVTDDESNGVSGAERAYCDACQQARPAAGSVQDGRYALCNACVLEYALAGARGHAVTAGQFVRDKVFGESTAYLFQDPDIVDIPAGADTLRPLSPLVVGGRPDRRDKAGAGGIVAVVRRPVLRLPRNRTA